MARAFFFTTVIMERTSWRSRIQKGLVVILVGLITFFVFTDRDGAASAPYSGSQALTRVERGFTSMVTWFSDGAREKNRDMQRVHDDYETRTEDRVKKSSGE